MMAQAKHAFEVLCEGLTRKARAAGRRPSRESILLDALFYRINIGVRHPSLPNGFLAGIECDRATYHSGVIVRDRDRLGQQNLEGLGWRLYWVWSTDWFRSRADETAQMISWLPDDLMARGAAAGSSLMWHLCRDAPGTRRDL